MTEKAKEMYQKIKKQLTKYDEELHCPMILRVMMDPDKGRVSSFCTEAMLGEGTFHVWVEDHELFFQCYAIGKMYAREQWELEGLKMRDERIPLGQISHKFEHWKMVGWARFGISKNNRLRVNLNPNDNPQQHYTSLLKQAASGDFTAAEIKQLMEAVNVGLNSHQIITLQKEIDELKSDLMKMHENLNVQNTFTNKGAPESDQDSMADSICGESD